MTHKEIRNQIPDYVLGILAPGRSAEVADHLITCTTCRQTVRQERKLGELVRGTLLAATRPDDTRLRSLMPTPPQRSPAHSVGVNWKARLAPAFAILMLITGVLMLRAPDSEPAFSIFGVATATATSTNTPTATVVQESAKETTSPSAISADIATATDTRPNKLASPVSAVPTPVNPPTPVALYSSTAVN